MTEGEAVAAIGRVEALCDQWDVYSKGESPTTRQIREAMRPQTTPDPLQEELDLVWEDR